MTSPLAENARDPAAKREEALREVLDLISRSRGDEAPVFDAIVRSAARLCDAPMAWLVICNDAQTAMTVAGYHGLSRRQIKTGDSFELGRQADMITGLGLAILEARTIQDEDLAVTPAYQNGVWDTRKLVDDEGMRTRVSIPLVSVGKGIGAIILSRREVAPFTPDQISLVESFAAQAVIAIENVRQFRELQTRLERERASAEILEVISQSRDDDGPVFEVIAQNAARLCGAAVCSFWRVEDGLMHYRASHGLTGDVLAEAQAIPATPLFDSTVTGQVVKTRAVVRIEDATAESYYNHEWVRARGLKQFVGVPIFVRDEVWGSITLMWPADRAPQDADIALVESFAAQASIAIENVRQFRELQARLEREAATREILEVISQSRDDDKPVFDVVLRKAADLCNASMASLLLTSEDRSHAVLAADWGLGQVSGLIQVGTTVWPMESDYVPSTCMREGRIAHIHDLADTDLYRSGDPLRVSAVDDDGIRTILAVPLFSGGQTAGCILVYRREVRPFSADEIALIETFAAQAVIAIENVRQFRELRDSLEQQQATSDILSVISQSREDEIQVFDLILEKAAVLCDADQGSLMIVNEARTHVRHMADWGHEHTAYHPGLEYSLDLRLSIVPTIRTAKVVHIEDYAQSDAYRDRDPIAVDLVETEGHRTRLVVPLLQNGIAIGCIALGRRTVRSFTLPEIQLVETFAAQAVIAIENVRQFRELQARLEREKATRDILEVISQSRDDNTPVFDMIVQNAARLCRADVCTFWRVEDGLIHYCASHGLDRAAVAEAVLTPPTPLLDNTLTGQVVKARAVARIDDAMAESYYDHEWARARGVKQMIGVPIFAGSEVWGSISLMWRAHQAHRDADIQLVESFAAQAAIAIENVRQFKALEALNAELGDRVQVQVGEIERMGRLKRFLPAAVADAVVSSGSERMLKSHRALLGVLFCDIRGFTAFCETAEPEETIEVLQTYHEEMGKLIEMHGAGVDHRMGDGIMVLFNDPLPCDDPAGQAVRLGLAMRDRMGVLCKGWKKLGHKLGFGVGISLGYATVGMVGSGGRIDYTASGTAINLASRLGDEALDGEILLSPRARLAVEDDFAIEPRGEITLKGMREPVDVFRVTGDRPPGGA